MKPANDNDEAAPQVVGDLNWDGLHRPHIYYAMAATFCGLFLSVIDGTICNVALPEIAQDFRSPYQPVRSFALSRLHHLLQTSDKESLAPELPAILSALKKGLNDDDSYVYLAAVNAMVILASTFHEQVLPILLETFSNAIAPLDLRLRVGEAIVCTVQYMKDACVK